MPINKTILMKTSILHSTLIALAVMIAGCFTAAAQGRQVSASPAKKTVKVERPDLDKIKAETLNPKSRFYFPKLMKRFEKNDTVMTTEEYRYLYLGYMFQEDYDPYRVSPYDEKTAPLKTRSKHTRQEVDTLIKYAELSLNDNPFDLRHMSFLVHALKEKEKTYRAKFWEFRLENLLAAIKSTGTGEDVENAWYVIYPAHEYDMVQLLGYNAVAVDFEQYPGYDILKVEPEEETARRLKNKVADKFFFNMFIPTEQFELKHPEDADDDEEEAAAVPAEEEEDPDNAPAQ